MNAPESAAFQQQNLAAGVAHFLGRGANNTDGEADLVRQPGQELRPLPKRQ